MLNNTSQRQDKSVPHMGYTTSRHRGHLLSSKDNDDQEKPAKTQTALDKELPEIVLICQREDATAKKNGELWVWIGFTLAIPTTNLMMSEVLAAVRAKVEKVKHQDWTSGPDHRYGFGEIEIFDHEVTPERSEERRVGKECRP